MFLTRKHCSIYAATKLMNGWKYWNSILVLENSMSFQNMRFFLDFCKIVFENSRTLKYIYIFNIYIKKIKKILWDLWIVVCKNEQELLSRFNKKNGRVALYSDSVGLILPTFITINRVMVWNEQDCFCFQYMESVQKQNGKQKLTCWKNQGWAWRRKVITKMNGRGILHIVDRWQAENGQFSLLSDNRHFRYWEFSFKVPCKREQIPF